MSGPPFDLAGPPPANQTSVRYLVATSNAGLCNRLLNLAGCLRLAEIMDRKLVLHWPLDWELNCTFEHLFENEFEPFDARHAYELFHTQNAVTVYETSSRGRRRPHYRNVVKNDDAHVIVVKGWGAPGLRWETGGKARLALPFLKSLVPVAALRRHIDAGPDLVDAIGVHMRRTNIPAPFGRSRTEDFVAILGRVLKRRPETRFHLATDDAATENRLRAEFGDRILTLEKTVYGPEARRGPAGMREAVVDLYRLARTRAVLGTDHSTYSAVGALLGSGRLLIANAKNAGTHRRGAWERLLD